MRAAIVVFALAALLVVVHAQSSSPTVGSDGKITLTPLNNPQTKSSSAIGTCYNATGTGDFLQTHANPSACESYQPCQADNSVIDASDDNDEVTSYSCFECDSFCDCDGSSFCLPNVAGEGGFFYSQRSQCVSIKSLVGQSCTSAAVAALLSDFNAPDIFGGDGAAQYSCDTSDLSSNPITDSAAITYRQVEAALAKGCGVYTTATNNSVSYLTVFGVMPCVDAKCSVCDPFQANNCGRCNSNCNLPTDRNHNAYCKTNGEVGTTDRTNGAKTSGPSLD